ncbi:MAG: hypothetical protein QGH39_09560 [Candidatus Thermoplasmatota archaeon]|jgi:hypothetical protein|nr:hypothetical protein [Candidatus Thermoplasmatota archaeon]MDP7265788.1 hypothetical protein [Candidatus Thermoplasmatota archaeon]
MPSPGNAASDQILGLEPNVFWAALLFLLVLVAVSCFFIYRYLSRRKRGLAENPEEDPFEREMGPYGVYDDRALISRKVDRTTKKMQRLLSSGSAKDARFLKMDTRKRKLRRK